MEVIDEIEKKLSNYENQYILENQSLIEKLHIFEEKEKKYKEHILELYHKLDELNIINVNQNKKNDLNYTLLKEENIQLKENYTTLKNNFDLLKKELNKEISKNDMLIDKYNKLSFLYEQKEKENISFNKRDIHYITDINSHNNNFYENEAEKEKIIFYCNNTISIFIKWIENNFISLNDSDNPQNEDYISNNNNNYINIDKNDLFIFDKLRNTLLQAKDTMDDYFYKEKERISIIEKQNNEIKNFLENLYHHLYEEVKREKYFDVNDNIDNEYECDKFFYLSEIEYLVDNIFILLKKIKESSFNKSLDKLIEDNIILNKEIENYKMKIIDLYNDNKAILDKYNELQNINLELKQQLSKGF